MTQPRYYIDPMNEPDGEGHGWDSCTHDKATAFAVVQVESNGAEAIVESLPTWAEAEKAMMARLVPAPQLPNCCPQCEESTEFIICDPEPPACSLCGWQDTERRLNLYECVTIDESNGASVRNFALLAEEVEEEGDELGAAKLYVSYRDVDAVLPVDDARCAALYILEQTGGLPPIKNLITQAQAALDKLDELLASETAGITSDTGADIEELQVALVQAISLARELGEF